MRGKTCEMHRLSAAGCLTQLLLALGAGIQSRDWPEASTTRTHPEPAGAHHSKRWSELRMPLQSRLLPRRCRTGLYLGRALLNQRPHAWTSDCWFRQYDVKLCCLEGVSGSEIKGADSAGRVGRAWRCRPQVRMSDGLLLAVGSCDDQDPGLHTAQDCLPHLPASPGTPTLRCTRSADVHTAGAESDPALKSLLGRAILCDDPGTMGPICAPRSKDTIQK